MGPNRLPTVAPGTHSPAADLRYAMLDFVSDMSEKVERSVSHAHVRHAGWQRKARPSSCFN